MYGLPGFKMHQARSTKKQSLLGGSLLSFLLVCSLLFTQTVSLGHSHDGDLRDQIDCEICLKVGSNDDSVVSTSELPIVKSTASSFQVLLPTAVHTVARAPSARAPPQA